MRAGCVRRARWPSPTAPVYLASGNGLAAKAPASIAVCLDGRGRGVGCLPQPALTEGCPWQCIWGCQPATGLALALALCPRAGSGPPGGWSLLFTGRVCKHDMYARFYIHGAAPEEYKHALSPERPDSARCGAQYGA